MFKQTSFKVVVVAIIAFALGVHPTFFGIVCWMIGSALVFVGVFIQSHSEGWREGREYERKQWENKAHEIACGKPLDPENNDH